MMVIGTVLPFSAISGMSILTLPAAALLPPVNSLIRSAASFDARAGPTPIQAAAATAPSEPTSTCRRSKVTVISVLLHRPCQGPETPVLRARQRGTRQG